MTQAERDPLRSIMVVATALTAAFFAFPIPLVTFATDPLYYYRAILLLADIPLAVVTAAVVVRAVRRRGHPSVAAMVAIALCAVLTLALGVHPSAPGAQTVLRAVAALALAAAIVTTSDLGMRPLVVASFGAAAVVEAGLAAAQAAQRGPLELQALGGFADPLVLYGSSVAPRGTMYHHYILAAFALLAALLLVAEAARQPRPWPWLAAAAIAVAPVGLTYSRAAVGGLAVACVGVALYRAATPRVRALCVAALLLGSGVPALLASDGWTVRAETSFDPSDPRIGREILMGEGLSLLSSSPAVGVGPSRMVALLRDREAAVPGSVRLLQPVHDVPILIAVEAGIAAGGLAAALLLIVAWRVRRSWIALAVLGAYLPFVLLDHFPYTYAQGLFLTGIWLGSATALARADRAADLTRATTR